MRHRGTQRGVALLVVLWACTLLAIMIGGYASLARVEGEQTRYVASMDRSRYLAEAGIMRAIHDLNLQRRSDAEPPPAGARWVGDGQPYAVTIDQAVVTVTVEDEKGKVDLNAADVDILKGLFVAAGADTDRATRLASEVEFWRKPARFPDPDARRRYESSGRTYAPRQGPFPSIDELQSVLGMDAALYARVAPAVTLWSERPRPEPYFAPPLVLSSLPGVDASAVAAYVTQRRNDPAGTGLPAMLGSVPAGFAQGSSVVTIQSTAKGEGQIATTLRVTVRFDQLFPTRDPRIPLYTILRWQNVPPT
ncbi:type II secretion system protein GspK [Rothia nasimurium]|uniref:General secretion pathway protein GspK n=1 Tax=Luteibacter anthropi TaxID=564369 RepID=A0A7X5ZHG1_9GAMM|nr:type II secretion system protein GspK [Luteibacter anthropi]NII05782.1 general secretion pathway protein GspK [Luteibacter anthropi]